MNSTTTPIVIIGGGGHASVCIELIERVGGYEIVGVVDPRLPRGSSCRGYPILGDDAVLPQLRRDGVTAACIGIGGVLSLTPRARAYAQAGAFGFALPALVHPSAVVARGIAIGAGAQIMAGAILQPDAAVGEDTIVNTGVRVDHDSTIGAHVHVCPGVTISGDCTIGDGAFIGAGATIIHGIRIGARAIIAAGSCVVRDVPEGATVMGVPARVREAITVEPARV